MPGLPVGHFETRVGTIMSAEDNFEIVLEGVGGHAARPNWGTEVLVAACALVTNLQTIVSRRLSRADIGVVSVTELLTDGTHNALSGLARILGDARSFRLEVSAEIEQQMRVIAEGTALTFNVSAKVTYTREFVPLIALAVSSEEAVSAVQQLTADLIGYMTEMGVDPALLQLSLQYDSDDMRYLSRSEMEQYRVITRGSEPNSPPVAQQHPLSAAPQTDVAGLPSPSTQASLLSIPEPRTGRIRHPKGIAPLKAQPDGKSANLATLANGTAVDISGSVDRWYRVTAAGQTGYLHHTWVFVDQYESGPFDQRHIQVRSFDNLAAADAYARSAPIPLAAYLATNGWFAVTLDRTFDQNAATRVVATLKAAGSIPEDAFVVYGNTYIRKVCCN